MKYFKAENAGNPKAGIKFDPAKVIGGTLVGVHSTDDAALIEALSKDGTVTEITAAEYEQLAKKKAPTSPVLLNLNPESSAPINPPVESASPAGKSEGSESGSALKGGGAKVSDGPPTALPADPSAIEQVLTPVDVRPPTLPEVGAQKKKK